MQLSFTQQVGEKLNYTIDFTAFLGTDTIKTSAGLTSTSVPTGELTIATARTTAYVATLTISGGTAGRMYLVRCLMESTTIGLKKMVDFYLTITE